MHWLLLPHTPCHCETLSKNLFRTKKNCLNEDEISRIALVGAAETSNRSLVNYLLAIAHEDTKARFFGDPFSASARSGNERILADLLERTLLMPSLFAATRVTHQLSHALVHAVQRNHLESARLLLSHKFLNLKWSGFHRLAVRRALQGGHVATAQLLLQKLPASQTSDYEDLWIDLLRAAIESHRQAVVCFVLDNPAFVTGTGELNLPLEDASRLGLEDIVKRLLDRHSKNSLTTYTGALYWAARCRHERILEMLFHDIAVYRPNAWMDALCNVLAGAASGDSHMLRKVITAAGYGFDESLHASAEQAFLQIFESFSVDFVPPNYAPDLLCLRTGSGVTSPSKSGPADWRDVSYPNLLDSVDIYRHFPDEVQPLDAACRLGQVHEVAYVLSVCRNQHPGASGEQFRSCCSTAAHSRRPGLLLYLLKTIAAHLSSDVAIQVQSTFIFQVFLDRGWDINEIFDRLQPPPLG